MKLDTAGFTLLELLVVIATIGVLATTLITSTNEARILAQDSVRKADTSSIAKALFAYNLSKGNWIEAGSGCGHNGDGNGWFNYEGTNYPKSISTCLLEEGFIPATIIDPSKNTVSDVVSNNAYMKYTCTESGRKTTYVYAKLAATDTTSTATDNTCCPTCDSSYGMNYYIKID
ncbi:MAG TPA: type II secretion system protein [Candidatus Paceibacterota bacterium]|nr:type II secretion system protein [Candidatus Paceibacterota bacterium]HMO82879.1 type II secretion system protein [Candidatus Paceibacterota bacterium]